MATEIALRITGIDCRHCAERLGSSLERLDGVIRAHVDQAGLAKVRYDGAPLSMGELAARVREAGFGLA